MAFRGRLVVSGTLVPLGGGVHPINCYFYGEKEVKGERAGAHEGEPAAGAGPEREIRALGAS